MPKKRKGSKAPKELGLVEGLGLSTDKQQYDLTSIINEVRPQVDQWRSWPKPDEWQVTPETRWLFPFALSKLEGGS